MGPNGHFHPHAWSVNGREIIAAQMADERRPTGSADLVRFAAGKDAVIQTVTATPASEGGSASLSHDGRWIAYTSNSTGTGEIWVRPFPGPGAPVRVSPNGGTEPVWARNGKELYYLEGPNLMAVAVGIGSAFTFEPPKRLFESTYQRSQPPSYDVAADGRFLMIKPDSQSGSAVSVIFNWQEQLRQRSATH